jgi:hypothetical protein
MEKVPNFFIFLFFDNVNFGTPVYISHHCHCLPRLIQLKSVSFDRELQKPRFQVQQVLFECLRRHKTVSCQRIITSEDSLNDKDLQKADLISFNTTTILYQFAQLGLLKKRMYETALYLTSTNANTVRTTQAAQFVNMTGKKLKKRKRIDKPLEVFEIEFSKRLKQIDVVYAVLNGMQ